MAIGISGKQFLRIVARRPYGTRLVVRHRTKAFEEMLWSCVNFQLSVKVVGDAASQVEQGRYIESQGSERGNSYMTGPTFSPGRYLVFQSHTSRFLTSVLITFFLPVPALAQELEGPAPLPDGTWRPPSYSEQKKTIVQVAPDPDFEEAVPVEPEYTVPLRKADGTLCFGPDSYDDNLKNIRVTCTEPWIRVERGDDSDWEPQFGWFCWPREHFCSGDRRGACATGAKFSPKDGTDTEQPV